MTRIEVERIKRAIAAGSPLGMIVHRSMRDEMRATLHSMGRGWRIVDDLFVDHIDYAVALADAQRVRTALPLIIWCTDDELEIALAGAVRVVDISPRCEWLVIAANALQRERCRRALTTVGDIAQ